MRISVVALLICTAVFADSAIAQDPVYFADATLKAAVEDALWVLDPAPADMLGLTELVCVNNGVTDITGLEYAENLQHLNLRFNRISGISSLSGLTNLRHLDLSRNYEISSISALSELTRLSYLNLHINNIEGISALSEMHDLTYLDLHGNRIVDVSALSQLGKLRHLDLNENGIEDITALSGLRKLEKLYLHYNQIHDITALADLTSVRTLNIYLNEISDISALARLTRLQVLSLHYNQVSDISALSALTHLTQLRVHANPLSSAACAIHLPQIIANNPDLDLEHDECDTEYTLILSSSAGGSVTEPGEELISYEHIETVAVAVTALPGYRFLNWTGTAVSAGKIDDPNLAHATVTIDATYSLQANFVENIIYVDDDAPFDPRPHDLGTGDALEDGSADHPFDSIQEAIHVASQDVLVLVRPGTYYEGINLMGKRIHVTGIDPTHTEPTVWPILAGDDANSIVTFNQGEDALCQFAGFVLTGGYGNMGAAISCLGSSPVIRNCLIVGNRCDDPDGAILLCQDSSPVFENLTVHGNYAGSTGSAFRFIDCNAMITNSIIWGNVPSEITVESGRDPMITYTNIPGVWPGLGNIDVNPDFAWSGYWTNDSQRTRIPGDYHLMSEAGRWDPGSLTWVNDELTSPCIDAGDPNWTYVHEPVPHDEKRINLGAYGGTDQASRSSVPALAYWRIDGEDPTSSVGKAQVPQGTTGVYRRASVGP